MRYYTRVGIVSITYGVRAEVQMESVLWKSENRNRSNIKEIMQLERDKYNRGGGMCRSRTYVDRDTAEIFSIRNNGISEG